jgi:hypothetical protein
MPDPTTVISIALAVIVIFRRVRFAHAVRTRHPRT